MIQDFLLPTPLIALGVVLLLVYLFKDRTRKYSIIILAFLTLWVLGALAEQTIIDFPFLSESFLIIAALFYFLRFRTYEQKRLLDWLKIPLVILFVTSEILGPNIYVNTVGAGLITLYIFDKTQYSNILEQSWKTAITLTFGLSILSIVTLGNLETQENMELNERGIERYDELSDLRRELITCQVDRDVLKMELNELETSSKSEDMN